MENNIETNPMNRDVFAGKWKQMRGELKTWWGKLTDDDFDTIGGQKDKLIGSIQERYGYTREQAEQEVERRLQEYGDKTGGAVAGMSAKAREFGATAARKANEAAPVLGEKIESLASRIREKAPGEGRLSTTATKVAGGLESASHYLQQRKFEHIGEDLRGLVRRYPLQTLLVGLGLGFLLAGRSNPQRRRRDKNGLE
jgi:uncharacterized protein YjbJ (UPF0337 family)